MATLTAQAAGITGAAITLVAAAGGGEIYVPTDSDRSFLWVKNGGGGSITVTISVAGNNAWGQANADVAVTLTAGTERFIGPLSPDMAGADTFNAIGITYSGVTSVTVAIVRLEDPSAYPPLPS